MSYNLILGLGACALIAACGDSSSPAPAAPVLTVQPQAVTILAGGSVVVGASVANAPAGAAITFRWRVRDSSRVVIHSLSCGGSVAHLRRVAPGGTVVTVEVPTLGLSAEIPVTVPLTPRHDESVAPTAPPTHRRSTPAALLARSDRQRAG
jgi:hypothetical protein